jgi:hypothetical protein
MSGWLILLMFLLGLSIYSTASYATIKVPDEEGKGKDDAKKAKIWHLIGMITGWVAVVVTVPFALKGDDY